MVARVSAPDELGERPDLGRGAVVDHRPVEPGEERVCGPQPGAVDAVDLIRRQLGERLEMLVRNERIEPLGAKPGREAVEPVPLGFGEEWACEIDPHQFAFEDSRGALVRETSLVVDRSHLEAALLEACADAGIEPSSVVAYVVSARRPAGTTPLAYLHPGGVVWPHTVAVFKAVAVRVGDDRLTAHRLAVWGELPGIPPVALGPMLRHELEHARRFERSGPRFFEADDLLRAAVGTAGGGGYAAIPSEREANAASAAYARHTLSASELDELRRSPDCAALLTAEPTPPDVVEATLAELARRLDWASWLDAAARRSYLAEVAAAAAAWDPSVLDLRGGRAGPEIVELRRSG